MTAFDTDREIRTLASTVLAALNQPILAEAVPQNAFAAVEMGLALQAGILQGYLRAALAVARVDYRKVVTGKESNPLKSSLYYLQAAASSLAADLPDDAARDLSKAVSAAKKKLEPKP